MTTYCTESMFAGMAEFEQLLPLHWSEIARDKEVIHLAPDWATYRAAELAGQLFMMVVRVDGRMVGYHICFVRPHLHYRESLSAITDVFYVLPEYRKGRIGVELFKESERALRARGVQKIFIGCKIAKDLTPLFERLGYGKIEYVFAKVIS